MFLLPMGAAGSGDLLEDGESGAKHEVRLACTEILKVAGMRGFHTSVIVDDLEFFFDREGIMAAPPFWSHTGRVQQPPADGGSVDPQSVVHDPRTQITEVGRSHISGRELVRILSPFFESGTYDIFHKNCNSFTDAALYLLVRQRLDSSFNRIERLVAATSPMSTDLLNRLFRAYHESSTGQAVDYDVHVTNPRAQGFTVDGVIASLKEFQKQMSDEDSEDGSDDAESDAESEDYDSDRSNDRICGDPTGSKRWLSMFWLPPCSST